MKVLISLLLVLSTASIAEPVAGSCEYTLNACDELVTALEEDNRTLIAQNVTLAKDAVDQAGKTNTHIFYGIGGVVLGVLIHSFISK